MFKNANLLFISFYVLSLHILALKLIHNLDISLKIKMKLLAL
jgi:hypothetical protein